MKVLVACEESQAVLTLLREKGHDAYSCDILECSGSLPQYHIKADVVPLLNGNCTFTTMDGVNHTIQGRWDCILAFPPCTHLATSGARHFEVKRNDGRQQEGIELFCQFLVADCDKIMIENPVNIISGDYITKWFPSLAMKYNLPRKPTQRIQPYEFGDPYKKTTCLWLKNLEPLKPTNIVEPKLVKYVGKDGRVTTFSADYGICKSAGERSKTYPGIASAIVNQWFNEV